MLISLLNLHDYLINRGLISSKSIVNDYYEATYYQYRSNIFIVKKEGENGLVLKQPQYQDESGNFLIQKEATTLWKIFNEDELKELRPLVPDYLGFDATSNVLATGFEENTNSFLKINGTASDNVNDKFIEVLTGALLKIHLSIENISNNPSSFFLPKTKPWIFNITNRGSDGQFYLHQYTPIIHIIIQDAFLLNILDEANEFWKIETLIHGDIKWSNILIKEEEKVKFIDWEMADFGDPLWDLAGLINSFITDEILNSRGPFPYVLSPQNSSIFEKISITIHKYLSYSKQLIASSENIHKIVNFTIMRLLQSSCEHNDYQQNLLPIAHSLIINASQLAKTKDDIVNQILVQINEKEI